MTERIFTTAGDWALGADSLQWILYKRRSQARGGWAGVSFVHSTRDILARCIHEKGCKEETARNLLAGLPGTFDEWKGARSISKQPAGTKHQAMVPSD
jgi:hypothetical protein